MPRSILGIGTIAFALLLGASPGGAPMSALEKDYILRRDAYIRQINRESVQAKSEQDREQLDLSAVHELAAMLRVIVGPVNVDDGSDAGESNVETLDRGNVPFGNLDGLRFKWHGGSLVVTTPALLEHWVARPDLRNGSAVLPKSNLAALLNTSDFYSFALFRDALYSWLIDIPVTHGGKATVARASAGFFENGGGCHNSDGTLRPPDTMIGVVVRSDRLFVFEVPLKLGLDQVPTCSKIAVDKECQGADAYWECYGRAIRSSPSFTSVTRTAQAFVDQLEKMQPQR